MLRRFSSVIAVGALALTSYSALVAAPASAGRMGPNTIEVTKVVVGENPGASGFQVTVFCETGMGPVLRPLTFGPEGGTEETDAPGNAICEVVETGTGGASKVEVSGSPCDFTDQGGGGPAPAQVEGETCSVTITNTFVPPEAGPAGPPGPPGEAEAAPAVVARARFTG